MGWSDSECPPAILPVQRHSSPVVVDAPTVQYISAPDTCGLWDPGPQDFVTFSLDTETHHLLCLLPFPKSESSY